MNRKGIILTVLAWSVLLVCFAGNPAAVFGQDGIYPPDGAGYVGINTDLSWTAGSGQADAYDVYLGTDYNSVLNATGLLPGDFDQNGKVTLSDLAKLSECWLSAALEATNCDFDFDSSGIIDPAELSVMAQNWLGLSSPEFIVRTSELIYDVGGLAANQTYHWRVDDVENSNPVNTGEVSSFTTGVKVKDGLFDFVSDIDDIDLKGGIVYAINCGSTDDFSVGSVDFKGDVYQWKEQSGDTNGDTNIDWWDTLYNANCPGKPNAVTIAGVTVECSDGETGGMDHGPYEGKHDFDVSGISGLGSMAQVLSTSGSQNLGNSGDYDMIYRLDVTPGRQYKLQLFFFKNSVESTDMDVLVEGDLVIDGLDVPVDITIAGYNKANTVLVYSTIVYALDTQIDIVIQGHGASNKIGDINAITLEDMEYDRENNIVTPSDSVANYDSLLSWDPVAGADSYNVYFGLSVSPGLAGSTANTTFNPGIMTKGQTYYWRVVPVTGGVPGTGSIKSFHVREGYLKLLDEIEDVDLDGCIIQGINCGKNGPVSDASIVINNVLYKPDVLVTNLEYLACDTNNDGLLGQWNDMLYNATNPGKPTSPTPIPGMTVQTSRSPINGMDGGPYESLDKGRVTSTIFPGQGEFYTGVYPPADDTAQGLRYLMYHNGVQNVGSSIGDQNMIFRLDTIPGHNYKLQILLFFNEQHDQQERALNLYIRPNNMGGHVNSGTSEKPEISCNIMSKIRDRGGSTDMQTPDAGLVYTYEFVGESDGRLDFEITRNPNDSCNLALINAIILEDTSPVATNPTPMNGEYYTSWKQKLSWDAAAGADSHDIYFGIDYNAVRDADKDTAVIFRGNQTSCIYVPGTHTMNRTCFWRVDEVNGGVTTKGETWSFTPDTDTGKYKVINTAGGEWIEHHDVKFPAGDFRFTANLSTKSSGKRVRLELNGDSHNYSFPVTLPYTNGLMRKIHLGHATLAADRYDMRFVFVDGGVDLDYFFERRSSDTTSSVLPEDTLLVPPSGTMEMITITGASNNRPCSGWPYSVSGGNGYVGYEFSMDIFSNHDAFNQQFWDYHVDCYLSSRIHAVQPHGAGLWDPMGVDDYGPFIGVRPTLPRLINAINRKDGAREYLKICQFDVASGQIREFHENDQEPEPKFNVATDLDHYKYWFDYCIKPFWSMVPKDMWYERDGHSPWYAWWDAPQGGGWWDPQDLNGHLKNWISYMRQRTAETFGTNLYFVGVGAQYVDNTITMDDVQAIVPLMDNEEDTFEAIGHYFGIGQWNSGMGQGTGNKYANCSPGFRGFEYDDDSGCVNDYNTYCTEAPRRNVEVLRPDGSGTYKPANGALDYNALFLDYSLSRMEDNNVTWVNIECWDDKDEDTSELPSTDTRVYSYPNEFINVLREHADPEMLSVRFEAELCDYYSDTTTGNSGTDFWQYRADPDSVNGGVATCDVDIDRVTGKDIGIAVNPFPLDCEVSVPQDVTLTWVESYGSGANEVYIGTDKNAVMYATTASPEYKGSFTTPSYTPPALQDDTTYYWRVDEVYGSVRYPSKTWQFSTPVAMRVENSGVSMITNSSARLSGSVANVQDGSPNVTIYWGDNDGGTNPQSWDYAVSIGDQSGDFYTDLTTLAPTTIYYYRCFGITGSGISDWANNTASFTTTNTATVVTLLDTFNDIDLSGNIVYALNCGSTSDTGVGSVTFRGDVYQWYNVAGDVNVDGNTDWWDNRYNANCPGKPASPSPIAGVTVECSDSNTNGMDHGPYEGNNPHNFDVSSLFSGQGGDASNMASVLSTAGAQNLGNPGERDMIFRFAVTSGKTYKLQMFFFKNSTDSTGMDVTVEGDVIIEDLDVSVDITNAGGDKSDTALMYSYTFTAGDSQADVVIMRAPSLNNIGDINAITLEEL